MSIVVGCIGLACGLSWVVEVVNVGNHRSHRSKLLVVAGYISRKCGSSSITLVESVGRHRLHGL